MKSKLGRYGILSFLACVGAIALCLFTAAPSQAHWSDLAAAEVIVNEAEVQMTLTFPTGLLSFADDDQNGQLSATEVTAHQNELQTALAEQIRLTDSENRVATLTLQAAEGDTLSPSALIAPNTHSTLQLTYGWASPVRGLRLHYGLFLPDVPTASCLTTILQDGQLKTHVFTPTQPELALTPGLAWFASGELVLAIAGAFVWGAVHSLSPGHGKTVVGAYLVGERATPRHAIFLAMITTITHTIGVFTLGLATLFAARYILPEQLYPLLSLASGLMVVTIGVNLLRDRLKRNVRSHSHHEHSHHGHSHHSDSSRGHEPTETQGGSTVSTSIQHHSQKYQHSNHHHQEHTYHHKSDRHYFDHYHDHSEIHLRDSDHSHDHEPHEHTHSHLPPGADGSPVTWRSLLTLGISGGLVPCPAALVLLLSAIALGNVAIGLTLVIAFSLGLACVLTSLGLLLVYAKQLFKRVPTQLRIMRLLPTASALGITLIGLGISAKAILQMQF